ncbi:MAG TPA: OFA family MFS transporter [Thermoplasmata archaeon]|nr:OFA family MFS transporter [Thermoplasmata archaeon]
MTVRLPRGSYLVVGLGMNLLLGTAYSWSVFRAALVAEFATRGADAFTALLPFAAAMAMFSVGMVFAGRAVDRLGPRKVALAGVLVFASGYMLCSLFDRSPWPMPTLTLLYGGLVGLGTGFGYNPTITTAVRWFPVRKGVASGIVVMGVGLSPVVTAPLAGYLIGIYGVPTTFLLLGILFLAVLVPLALLLQFPPAGWEPPAAVVTKQRRAWRPLTEVGPRTVLRSRVFWTAWTLYVLGTAEGFMVIGNAFTIAKEVGFATDAVATLAVIVLALFNSAGRPVFGRLADQWSPRETLLVMYTVLLGAMALLSVSSGLEPVFLGVALTGIVFGGFLAVMPALSTLYFGERHAGANYGLLFTAFGVGNLVALFAGGWIRETTGAYLSAFYVGLALSAVGLVLSLEVRPPRAVPAPG